MCAPTIPPYAANRRTHGIHAEPITFGLKIAIGLRKIAHIGRFREPPPNGRRKIPAPSGNASHLGPERKNVSANGLGLALLASLHNHSARPPCAVSQRLALSRTLEKIALKSPSPAHRSPRSRRTLQWRAARSSAMLISATRSLANRFCGLARLVRSNMLAAFENIALWTTRHFSQFRRTRPFFRSTILVATCFEGIDHGPPPPAPDARFPDRMMRNLESHSRLIYSDSCCRFWWRRACRGTMLTRRPGKRHGRVGIRHQFPGACFEDVRIRRF